ncbi:hypothetical protein ET495_11220 [Xylanimonas allomyrinae]|uniref:Alternate-type signal peptide domain-containing protein n=1 Tax=Xylanimonas allomyrinae TaxID=2509459 RepID=A0A4P6EM20_9MICO|nr:SipW-dependent-type signal peptide-containing protein [Xylanimonas allomyrinae]QAY63722.1 hypothetical protein ET495_11220 [Xylanimonas allomyrinae]
MNNKTKGWIAAALGGVLLLSTGGTFAVWKATDTIQGARITAGTISLAVDGFEWRFSSDTLEAPEPIAASGAPASFTLPEGATAVGTATISAGVVGLTADLEVGAVTVNGDVDPASLTVEASWAWDGAQSESGTRAEGDAEYTETVEHDGTGTLTVTVTRNVGEPTAAVLDDITVTLTQRA